MGFHYKCSLQVHHRHNDHQRDLQTVVLVYLYHHHDAVAVVHHPNPGKKEGLLVAMGNSPHPHHVVVVVGGDSQVLKGTEDSFPRVVKGDHFGHRILVGVVDVDVVGGGAKMRY
jgi:hypothetical protein